MKKDVMGQVMLQPEVVVAWQRAALIAAEVAKEEGLQPQDIPDEQMEVLESGELYIHVTLADGRILAKATIPAEGWSWMAS